MLACRNCGSDNIVAWYPVSERQGITLHGVTPDGNVSFDYDGTTDTADEAGEDDEYWCLYCDTHSHSLEYLLGVIDKEPPTEEERRKEKLDRALDAIAWARTALDDPQAIDQEWDEVWVEAVETSESLDRIYAEAAPSPVVLYAIAQIDTAMGLLRREAESNADSPARQDDQQDA
jgi:hypothetical protein